MNQHADPNWWDASYEFAWNHVKIALRHHWNLTKNSNCEGLIIYEEGGTALNRVTGEQIKSSCNQSTFEELEPAYRFGYGAHLEYGDIYPAWNSSLELCLAKDWWAMNPDRKQTWEDDREAIRYGWEFDEREAGGNQEGEEWKKN